MLMTPKQHEKIAQGFLKAARDKKLKPQKRLELRGQAKRFRQLAKLAADPENQKPAQ
ncbi:MAG: hypothetical protein WA441_03420 [Methyloceanibacter sp.]|jgi:hypothetical protein